MTTLDGPASYLSGCTPANRSLPTAFRPRSLSPTRSIPHGEGTREWTAYTDQGAPTMFRNHVSRYLTKLGELIAAQGIHAGNGDLLLVAGPLALPHRSRPPSSPTLTSQTWRGTVRSLSPPLPCCGPGRPAGRGSGARRRRCPEGSLACRRLSHGQGQRGAASSIRPPRKTVVDPDDGEAERAWTSRCGSLRHCSRSRFSAPGWTRLRVDRFTYARTRPPMTSYAEDLSDRTYKTIGVLEVLGAIGLVLPRLLGIAPVLTPARRPGVRRPDDRSDRHAPPPRRTPAHHSQYCS